MHQLLTCQKPKKWFYCLYSFCYEVPSNLTTNYIREAQYCISRLKEDFPPQICYLGGPEVGRLGKAGRSSRAAWRLWQQAPAILEAAGLLLRCVAGRVLQGVCSGK